MIGLELPLLLLLLLVRYSCCRTAEETTDENKSPKSSLCCESLLLPAEEEEEAGVGSGGAAPLVFATETLSGLDTALTTLSLSSGKVYSNESSNTLATSLVDLLLLLLLVGCAYSGETSDSSIEGREEGIHRGTSGGSCSSLLLLMSLLLISLKLDLLLTAAMCGGKYCAAAAIEFLLLLTLTPFELPVFCISTARTAGVLIVAAIPLLLPTETGGRDLLSMPMSSVSLLSAPLFRS